MVVGRVGCLMFQRPFGLKSLYMVVGEALEPRFKAIAPTYLVELGNEISLKTSIPSVRFPTLL